MTALGLSAEEVIAARRRRRDGQQLAEEADMLAGSFREFLKAAWPHANVGRPLVPTWHLDAIADHVDAAYARDIPRLLITIQPGAAKSWPISSIAPAWRWASAPEEQIVSASHTDALATRDTRRSRSLIATAWYQARWPHVQLLRDENLKTRYTNTAGGYRVTTHVGGGTGERGTVLILDDPHNADDANSLSETGLSSAREWIGNTWSSRLNMSLDDPGVKIVVGQRVHVNDVIGFLLDGDVDTGRWVQLCLPTRYDPAHPFVYPDRVFVGGRELQGDERTEPGELLAPAFMDAAQVDEVQHDMTEQTRQAQYQQNPTPREGAILKRALWRYYPKARLDGRGEGGSFPPFRMIVSSWDTSFKAKVTSDKVAGGVWGFALRQDPQTGAWIPGADHYLLRTLNQRLSLAETKTAMQEFRLWALTRWPTVPVYTLIEKSANGVEIIEQLEREIDGVVAYHASVDKKLRAEAASPALEGGNCFLPGEALPEGTGPNPARTDDAIMAAVEQCAKFTGRGTEEDDWVDQFTQMINWGRTKDLKPAQVHVPTGQIARINGANLRGRDTGIRISR